MARKKPDETKIIRVLQEARSGMKVDDVIRRHGISQGTFYKWREKYGEMSLDEAKRLRLLEEENSRLKKIVADLTLDNTVLKDVLSKNW